MIALAACSYTKDCPDDYIYYNGFFVNRLAADAVLSVKYSYKDTVYDLDLTAELEHDIHFFTEKDQYVNGNTDMCGTRTAYDHIYFSEADAQSYTICMYTPRVGDTNNIERYYELNPPGESCSEGGTLAETYPPQ